MEKIKQFNQEEFNQFTLDNDVCGFFDEEIILVSGRKSHFYVNWRNVSNDVWLIDKLANYIISFIKSKHLEVDTFYGVPEGATKLGVITQYKWAKMSNQYFEGTHTLAMGRAKIKDHGLPKDKYFAGMPTGKVVVIEDLVTVGTNSLPVINNLKDAGVDVVAMIVLTNRMEKRDDGLSVQEAVEQKGVKFFNMSSALDILPMVYKKVQPSEEIGRKVEDYYKQYGISQLKLIKPKFLNKEISGIFTIPSGIVATDIKVMEKIAREIPEIGVLTTKSIGLEPRQGNREPIFSQYAPGSFINAVGLTNPGAEEFAKQLKQANFPKDKFILTSIFGKDADEFVQVAKIVASYSDGLELNLSCPHAEHYGMAIGQDKEMIKKIVAAVKAANDIPVIPKLSPNVINIAEIAKAAEEAGADAISAINTVGPGFYSVGGSPVLSNQKGGISGRAILPIGLRCVKEISEAVNIPIIACGGISRVQDVIDYQNAGAGIIGIGSSLVGLSAEELKEYFSALNKDIEEQSDEASFLLKQDIEMGFRKYKLIKNKKIADDLSLLIFDKGFGIKPGQFVFAWLPGFGEKPFSVLENNPLILAVQNKGCLTEKLISLIEGDEVYFRGPYGIPISADENDKIILIGGGCGMAALYPIAKEFNNAEIFFGAKDRNHLFYLEKMKECATINIATQDNSGGYNGLITDLLKEKLSGRKKQKMVFFNCGPEEMIEAAIDIEKEYAPMEKIYNAVDYITKCGVGICGSCATKRGERLCADGPFINEK